MMINVTEIDFQTIVLRSALPVLVEFTSQTCTPCRVMIPVMEQIAAEYADEILVCQIDVNIAPAIADKYKINMLPTVILFDNGNVKNILTGVQSKTKIQSVLNE